MLKPKFRRGKMILTSDVRFVLALVIGAIVGLTIFIAPIAGLAYWLNPEDFLSKLITFIFCIPVGITSGIVGISACNVIVTIFE